MLKCIHFSLSLVSNGLVSLIKVVSEFFSPVREEVNRDSFNFTKLPNFYFITFLALDKVYALFGIDLSND